MFRCTTPTFKFKIIGISDFDSISDIWVTIKGIGSNSDFIQTKKEEYDEVVRDPDTHTVSVSFTQEETKNFKGNEVLVQIKLKITDDDNNEKVYASSIHKIQVSSPLNDEFM